MQGGVDFRRGGRRRLRAASAPLAARGWVARRLAAAGLGGVFALLLPAAAFAAPYWAVLGDSPQARSIQHLFWIVIGVAFVFLFGIEGALLYVVFRFRARPGDEGDAPQVYGNRRLEVWWTIVPALILVVMFIFTVRAVGEETAVAPNALPVTVIGHQWWWEFRYPTLGVVTANELHVPVGRSIDFTLESADVVHSFWLPLLGGKEQLIPGQKNRWTFTVDKAGSYDGACSEYCGGAHAWMRLTLVADTPAQFEAWAKAQAAPAASTGASAKALRVFTQNACSQCHAIRGTTASGAVAPDLTHVGSRTTLGGGVLANNAGDMARWLENPQAVKPGVLMPDLHLSADDLSTLTAYLEGLK